MTYWISSEDRGIIRQLVGIDAANEQIARVTFIAKYPERRIRSVRTDYRDQTGAAA